MDPFRRRPLPPPPEEERARRAIQDTDNARKELHLEEVIEVAQQLKKAYEVLLTTRRARSKVEEELADAEIRNLEKQLAGQQVEDLDPLKKRVEELRKKEEAAEKLVRLLEMKAKRIDPQRFSFIP
jgi:hypothetical protein